MMRLSFILSLVLGLLIGFLLSNQVATSQEEPLPIPGREAHGRFQIAGRSGHFLRLATGVWLADFSGADC